MSGGRAPSRHRRRLCCRRHCPPAVDKAGDLGLRACGIGREEVGGNDALAVRRSEAFTRL